MTAFLAVSASLGMPGSAAADCPQPANIKNGEKLYTHSNAGYCISCHGDPGWPCFSSTDAFTLKKQNLKPHKWCSPCKHPKEQVCQLPDGSSGWCTGTNLALYGAMKATLTSFQEKANGHAMMDEAGYPGLTAAGVQKLFSQFSAADINDLAAYLAFKDPTKYTFGGTISGGGILNLGDKFPPVLSVCSEYNPSSIYPPQAQPNLFSLAWGPALVMLMLPISQKAGEPASIPSVSCPIHTFISLRGAARPG